MHEFLLCKPFRFNDLVYADAVDYTWLEALTGDHQILNLCCIQMCKCFIDESYLGDCYAYAGTISHSLIHTSFSTASLQFCLPFNSVWLNTAAAFFLIFSSVNCVF
jgi:hypothetical protein